MEEVIVNYTRFVQIYFDNLIEELFSQDYFIYHENAIDYVEKFVFYINTSIQQLPHRKSSRIATEIWRFLCFLQIKFKNNLVHFFLKKEINLFNKTHFEQP